MEKCTSDRATSARILTSHDNRFNFLLCRASKAEPRPEEGWAQRAIADQTREGSGPVAAQTRPLSEADLEWTPGGEPDRR
jgi:hypothetical protein